MKKLTIRTGAFLAVLALLTACAPALPVTGGGGAAPAANTVTVLPTATTAPATAIPPTAAPSPTMRMPATAPQPAAPTDAAQPGDALEVSIANFAFSPDPLTVPAGTKVRWTNKDTAPHTVTADNDTFDSGTLNTGDTFEFTFGEAGTYTYFCAFHPDMVGTIIVTGAPDSGSDASGGTDSPSEDSPTPDSGSGGSSGSGGYDY